MAAETADKHPTKVELNWHASPFALHLAIATAVALAVAVIGSSWQLVVFAAPLVGVLVSARWQRPSGDVHLHTEHALLRCFEGEQVTLSSWATTDSDDVRVTVDATGVTGAQVVVDRRIDHLTMTLSAERWGRYPVHVRVDANAQGALLAGTATVAVADVFVFPVAPPQATPTPRTELLDRLGTHLTRHVGRGVEYADVRAYVPGDQLRSVNWPVSARRGSLHVTERLSERAADVVVLLDNYVQPSGPATRAAERSVRGAVQVVQSALRNGDRAGIVTLGGQARWLGAEVGRRQFYRVLDAVLAAGDGYRTTSGTLAPRAAVPRGAIVVAFSTLLAPDFTLALVDLAKRGHVVIVVDVLDVAPFEDEPDPLITRMWALQRFFMYRDMRTIGVDVVPWPGDRTLDDAMRVMPDRRRRSGVR